MEQEEFFSKLQLDNSGLWSEFIRTGDLNVLLKLSLRPFEVIVAVSALRPDSLYRAITGFVDEVVGKLKTIKFINIFYLAHPIVTIY